MTKKQKAVGLISRVMAAVMVLSACHQFAALTAYADSLSLTPKFHENAVVEVSGSKITVTDNNYNDDVWNSKVLVDTGMKLEPGKQYTVDFSLTGQESVGEFFLCKTESMDARYDDTFTTDGGRSVNTFTAIGDKLYIGMQVGDAGMDNSVTCDVASIKETVLSDVPTILKSSNCDVVLNGGTITATDTNDNNDVWNSKVLFDAGVELQVGMRYNLNVDLAGDNGVGEFFVCKSLDMNDRVDATFCDTAGSKNIDFVAKSNRLYIGMQFGNIGKGNKVTTNVLKVTPVPPEEVIPTVLYTVEEVNGKLIIKAMDNSLNPDVWNSRVLVPLHKTLEPGKKYEISIDLSGTNGVGELFLCQTGNMEDVKDRCIDMFDNAIFTESNGLYTTVIEAKGPNAFIGMQMGNVGFGNTVTAAIGVKEFNEATGNDLGLKVAQNCVQTVTFEDGKTVVSVKDTGSKNEVFTSKVMGLLRNDLTKGKEYFSIVKLAGSTDKVGEFYFLKNANPDLKDRYSFDDKVGTHVVSFTAEDNKVYAGLQFGDVGVGESVEVTYTDLLENNVAIKENCVANVNEDQTKLIGVDTNSDEVGVWTSKLAHKFVDVFMAGKQYFATIITSSDSDNKGEFFLAKADNLGEGDKPNVYRDTLTGGEVAIYGDGTGSFNFGAAEDTYAFMQFGNAGYGNSYTAEVTELYESPVTIGKNWGSKFAWDRNNNSLKVTDDDEGDKDYNSLVMLNTGIALEAGKEYTIVFALDSNAENVGNFFLCKSEDEGNRIKRTDDVTQDVFANQKDSYSFKFKTDEDASLYLGIQAGNIGQGNTMTVSGISIKDGETELYHERDVLAANSPEPASEPAPAMFMSLAEGGEGIDEPVETPEGENIEPIVDNVIPSEGE